MIPVMFWLTWSMVKERLPELLHLPMMPVPRAPRLPGFWLRTPCGKRPSCFWFLGLVMLIRERSSTANGCG